MIRRIKIDKRKIEIGRYIVNDKKKKIVKDRKIEKDKKKDSNMYKTRNRQKRNRS